MSEESTVIASGNLASPRRIIAGVLGQFGFLELDEASAREILTNAGLPARALEEPDFPISLQQELEICADLVSRLPADVSPIRLLFEARQDMGIENLGTLVRLLQRVVDVRTGQQPARQQFADPPPRLVEEMILVGLTAHT